MKKFNEDTRVKIPTILHLVRLGYDYLSLKENQWDKGCNIFTDIFLESILRINPKLDETDALRLLEEVKLSLDNEDLGQAFYKDLVDQSGTKLIDFENFDNNSFNVVTELTYKNGDEEFRPDIILLINGMPLVFIEVKKPNNKDGVIAERDRINKRFQNKKFQQFVNITQLMIFSNNMEYENEVIEPLQGAFYATTSYHKPIFNYFREEEALNIAALLKPEDDAIENKVLRDNNLTVIKHNPEFKTNKHPDRPTNRICTSLVSRERLSFILQYAIAYVKESSGLQKHIMRYPQLFATKAIEKELNAGLKKGIIWHTQGSGKTALTYFNVKFLTDYFQQKNIIPKFYFIVDRLDLLVQAQREFSSRGLTVHIVNSREDFVKDMKTTTAVFNLTGKAEITVVNIHKFSEDATVFKQQDYDINVQRIYFLDEVHRSYNPKGSFLANLNESDQNSIKIGLTGTPLIEKNLKSKHLFGKYIHKYYYNASIADGYTLRLIREEIATEYKLVLEEALKKIEVLKGDVDKKTIYSHPTFVEPMLKYMVEDFEDFRYRSNDNSIGAMVVCDSSEQAKMLFKIFQEQYAPKENSTELNLAAEETPSYANKLKKARKVKSAVVILHDVGTKKEREKWVEDFKDGKIDFLFVYNMLLTGFDAKRLKKLYIGRLIKRHNLLQTLTRVNRTYKDFKYGYVVDFANISKEFDATNKAYFEELQEELGDEMESYSNLFKSKKEIEIEIEELKDLLWRFDTNNLTVFSQQIIAIEDRKQMSEIKKALGNAKALYNLIRLFGHYELLEKIDFKQINNLYNEAANHLEMLNTRHALANDIDNTNLLNIALEDVIFMFKKIKEEEMILAGKLQDSLYKTREALLSNFDHKDPEFVNLYDELERLFKKKGLDKVTQEDMKQNIGALKDIYNKIKELNHRNDLLRAKYQNDPKYARVHKRIVEQGKISKKERQIFEALQAVKAAMDELVLQNTNILNNESYFNSSMIRLVIEEFKNKNNIPLDAQSSKFINNLLVKEYINEYNNRA